MEVPNKEESQLSGAYIRSLVKQLTPSKGKPKLIHGHGDLSEIPKTPESKKPHHHHHKKQVRKRLHTSRPYQERLLNMAEARREIVTALKYHRATMKQANQNQHHIIPPSPSPCSIIPQTNPSFDHFSLPSFSWPICSIPPPPPQPLADNLNFGLPIQPPPLGLNLNFHDFNNLETNLYHNPNNLDTFRSTSSSSSPPLSYAIAEEVASVPMLASQGNPESESYSHPSMEELRSIGEQYQMEWNDKMNSVSSARWFQFLRCMEEEDDGYRPLDEVMEFPAPYIDDLYFQDAALPCMDIGGEIEGDWLA